MFCHVCTVQCFEPQGILLIKLITVFINREMAQLCSLGNCVNRHDSLTLAEFRSCVKVEVDILGSSP